MSVDVCIGLSNSRGGYAALFLVSALMNDHLGTTVADIFGALRDLKMVSFYERGLASPLDLLYHNIHTHKHLPFGHAW